MALHAAGTHAAIEDQIALVTSVILGGPSPGLTCGLVHPAIALHRRHGCTDALVDVPIEARASDGWLR
jgi:hypothetical protein